jgi:putative ATPase
VTEQPGLFGAEAGRGETAAAAGPVAPVAPGAPLSTRMRPRSLEEFVGQEHAVGPQAVLRRALESDTLPSIILWGPPGSGKTTLAGIVASMTGSAFEAVSAVTSGVAELRRIVDRAAERRRSGRRTLLFIDEIHRFNRAQQDAILPHVESGLVRLLGATTENPGFEVNAALLSRARVVRLEALDSTALRRVVERALADTERGLGGLGVEIEEAALDELVARSGGDARVALDALEIAAAVTPSHDGRRRVDREAVLGALQHPTLLSDRAGDQHYWMVSALIKSVRGSDPDAAVYWLARMLEAGEDPVFVARRLVILAAEDVGLADPGALSVAVAAQQAAHLVGMPEARLPLTQAALHLAIAPKSNSTLRAYAAAAEDARATLQQPVPLHLRNAATALGRELGFGSGYQYAHDHADGIVEQQYLPDALAARRYYEPSRNGAEARVADRLEQMRSELERRRDGERPAG